MEDFERVSIIYGSNSSIFTASLALRTESGEIADNVKKHLFYGKNLDKENIVEELGDILWYVSTCCNAIGDSSGPGNVP